MCGIAGYVSTVDNRDNAKHVIMNMLNVLKHRGPNDHGYKVLKTKNGCVAIGHRRLSILDLSILGHQPMSEGLIHITYNGEVFNFIEIREELVLKGYLFNSNTDTEVILLAYKEWGIECVKKFVGFFAFCIVDQEINKIFLVRDRAGVKPLYYMLKDNCLIFSSEIKSILENPHYVKKINNSGVLSFLKFGYVLTPNTIYTDLFKLEPGTYIELDIDTFKYKKNVYWDIAWYFKKNTLLNEEEVLFELEHLIQNAIKNRMISDVPVGVFLSGGLDSSLIALLAQKETDKKINTFTIGFQNKEIDESKYAKNVAAYIGSNHHEYIIDNKVIADLVEAIPNIFDEPLADNSVIPSLLLSEFASKYVTVVLSGEGGDETFIGYPKYKTFFNIQNGLEYLSNANLNKIGSYLENKKLQNIPILNQVKGFDLKYNKFVSLLKSSNSSDKIKSMGSYFTRWELDNLIKNKDIYIDSKSEFDAHFDGNIFEEYLLKDYKTYLQNQILYKLDMCTMNSSIEGREPLLDHNIIEFVASLPLDVKFKNSELKYLEKKIIAKHFPAKMFVPQKQGLVSPIDYWLRHELRFLIDKYLDKDFVRSQDIFEVAAIEEIKKKFFLNKESCHKVWLLISFQMWYSRWVL